MEKILATEKAKEVISQLKERYGDLMFYMSGGCCEGSQPMCYEKGEYKPGSRDVLFGKVEGCEFHLSEEQNQYYQYAQLLLDAIPGMGGGFSLETVVGMAFSVTTNAIIAKEDAEVNTGRN